MGVSLLNTFFFCFLFEYQTEKFIDSNDEPKTLIQTNTAWLEEGVSLEHSDWTYDVLPQ